MLRVVESRATITRCQRELKANFNRVTTRKARHTVGFPSGTQEAEVFYAKDLDLWMTFKPIRNRYWNCAGIGDPFASPSPAPHVEINPPLEGINRTVAGAFLVDEDGTYYLGHSGKVGGGAVGVSMTNFHLFHPGWSEVMSGDQLRRMYVLGALDGDDLPERIRDFTRQSKDFRERIKRGEPLLVDDALDDESVFRPEFEGHKVYGAAARVEADVRHGAVVRALRDALAERGIKAWNSQQRDLFVRAADGAIDTLFEVKTDCTSTSVYTGIGQLMYHGTGPRVQRVLVLPTKIPPAIADRVTVLGITVLPYTITKDLIVFDGLASMFGR
jgi:hypothetical protein